MSPFECGYHAGVRDWRPRLLDMQPTWCPCWLPWRRRQWRRGHKAGWMDRQGQALMGLAPERPEMFARAMEAA